MLFTLFRSFRVQVDKFFRRKHLRADPRDHDHRRRDGTSGMYTRPAPADSHAARYCESSFQAARGASFHEKSSDAASDDQNSASENTCMRAAETLLRIPADSHTRNYAPQLQLQVVGVVTMVSEPDLRTCPPFGCANSLEHVHDVCMHAHCGTHTHGYVRGVEGFQVGFCLHLL
jgi:hypothetical protein